MEGGTEAEQSECGNARRCCVAYGDMAAAGCHTNVEAESKSRNLRRAEGSSSRLRVLGECY